MADPCCVGVVREIALARSAPELLEECVASCTRGGSGVARCLVHVVAPVVGGGRGGGGGLVVRATSRLVVAGRLCPGSPVGMCACCCLCCSGASTLCCNQIALSPRGGCSACVRRFRRVLCSRSCSFSCSIGRLGWGRACCDVVVCPRCAMCSGAVHPTVRDTDRPNHLRTPGATRQQQPGRETAQ